MYGKSLVDPEHFPAYIHLLRNEAQKDKQRIRTTLLHCKLQRKYYSYCCLSCRKSLLYSKLFCNKGYLLRASKVGGTFFLQLATINVARKVAWFCCSCYAPLYLSDFESFTMCNNDPYRSAPVLVRQLNTSYFWYVPGCNCNLKTTTDDVCDNNGKCLCKKNFMGDSCNKCKSGYYGYPQCTGKYTASPPCWGYLTKDFLLAFLSTPPTWLPFLCLFLTSLFTYRRHVGGIWQKISCWLFYQHLQHGCHYFVFFVCVVVVMLAEFNKRFLVTIPPAGHPSHQWINLIELGTKGVPVFKESRSFMFFSLFFSECDCKSGFGRCGKLGECICFKGYTGRSCDRCADGYYGFPHCSGR